MKTIHGICYLLAFTCFVVATFGGKWINWVGAGLALLTFTLLV